MKVMPKNVNLIGIEKIANKNEHELLEGKNGDEVEYKMQIVWVNTLFICYLHLVACYTTFLLLTGHVMLRTFAFQMILGVFSSFGITMGAHRLWAHKAYKAKLPLKIILAFFMSLSFVNDIFTWARDHRVHHKFSETNADPHNAKRGFFFAHCGWLMCKKHPDVQNIGGRVSFDDLRADKVVMFHKKYYILCMVPCTFILPTWIPYHYWSENSLMCFYMTLFRYVLTINLVWSLNSVSHIFGTRPFDKHTAATEQDFMKLSCLGEGFHNYHHTFPWDYKASEYGNDWRNSSTYFINFFAWLGWAYDLKTASREMILKRVVRTGDGTYEGDIDAIKKRFMPVSDPLVPQYWGWDDTQITEEERRFVEISSGPLLHNYS